MKQDLAENLVVILAVIGLVLGIFLLYQEFSIQLYNQLTGFAVVGTTLNITPAEPTPCDFTLREGMNLVSFFCIGDFSLPEEVFNDTTNLIGIWGYDPSSSDPWKAYKPDLPNFVVNDLTFMSKKSGYWVKMNASRNYFFSGPLPLNTSIPISTGYQLVGYPDNESKPIATSLQSINGSYSKVVGFDPDTKTFLTYVPGSGGSLTTTDAYRGYWINGTASDTWVVN